MAKIVTYTGLTLLAFCGSALDSQGLAGWIAIAGVLAGLGLIALGIKAEARRASMYCTQHGGDQECPKGISPACCYDACGADDLCWASCLRWDKGQGCPWRGVA